MKILIFYNDIVEWFYDFMFIEGQKFIINF